jgi:phosphatidylinositol 4-kinase
MKNFVSKLEKEEIKEQQEIITRSKLKTRSTIVGTTEPRKYSLSKYQIRPNEDLKKFEAIYISGKTPNHRRSEMSFNDLNSLEYPDKCENLRKSGVIESKVKVQQIETYIEGEFKDCNMMIESIWGQAWELKKVKYNMRSNFTKFRSLRFRNVVVKGGDDLRQEIICMQLIYKMRDIIRDAGVDVFIKPYEIIVLSENSGILEFVPNSISVDEMKKKSEGSSICKFFIDVFQDNLKKAKECFVRSLVGSSILTYVLKLKDRHNGNILLDMDGNIIHIDFGFILGMAPGNLNFESSPFKFTAEYVELIGGKESENYPRFVSLFCDGMMALRKRVDELTLIL